MKKLVHRIFGALFMLGCAAGLPHGLPDIMLEMADGFDPNWNTSMCNDLEAGKP